MTLPQTEPRKPQWAIQVAMVATMKADSALVTLLANDAARVTDAPPEGMAKPYVQVGEHLSIDDDDLTSFGHETTVTLHVWTMAQSNKTGEDISSRIHTLFHRQHEALSVRLAAAGHRCVSIKNEFSQALRDPDPKLRHHVLRFRVVTAQLY